MFLLASVFMVLNCGCRHDCREPENLHCGQLQENDADVAAIAVCDVIAECQNALTLRLQAAI